MQTSPPGSLPVQCRLKYQLPQGKDSKTWRKRDGCGKGIVMEGSEEEKNMKEGRFGQKGM